MNPSSVQIRLLGLLNRPSFTARARASLVCLFTRRPRSSYVIVIIDCFIRTLGEFNSVKSNEALDMIAL